MLKGKLKTAEEAKTEEVTDFADIFSEENMLRDRNDFGDDFDFGSLNPTRDDLKKADATDPFSTAVKGSLFNSYIDRCERAHREYIELARNPFTAGIPIAQHQLIALRHIAAYWAHRHEESEGIKS